MSLQNEKQQNKVRCLRCRTWFDKITSKSGDISSFSFPIYKIQRYKDYDSQPQEINLCINCSDKLDRFLYIYTEGQDYYRNDQPNESEEPSNE